MNLKTDHHCHLLPGIDDGAKDGDVSKKMMELLVSQGVDTVYATPHYYHHRESVSAFSERRLQAEEKIAGLVPDGLKVIPAAEIALEPDICEDREIASLGMKEGVILIELPFSKRLDWVEREIDNLVYGLSLTPVFAHIERYVPFYPSSLTERIFGTDRAVFQITNGALREGPAKKVIRRLLEEEQRILLGSDAHEAESRRPDFDTVVQPLKKLLRDSEPENFNIL